jgi:phage terminase Nu1 subunit (DNA packaging protein)
VAHIIKDIEYATRKEISSVFGVHPSTISRWVARDRCPRNPDGTFDLRKVIIWRLEENDLEQAPCENEEARRWMTQFRRERALLAKIDRRRAEGELIAKEEIAAAWAKRAFNMRSSLLTLVDRLPPLIEGKDRKKIAKILKDEIYYFLEQYSQHGKYCPNS